MLPGGLSKEYITQRRAFLAVKYVLDVLIICSLIAAVILIVRGMQVDVPPRDHVFRLVFTTGFLVLAVLARTKVRTWYSQIWTIISFLTVSFSLSLLILLGSDVAIAYVTFVIVIYGTCIVGSWKTAEQITKIIVISVVIIAISQYYFGYPFSLLLNTLMLCIFLWINFRIAKLGFSEIEYSYDKAISYAVELEMLNKDLEKRVYERTQQLHEDFEKRIEIYEREAEIGYITKALIHDIRTPLSSISLTINMIEENNKSHMIDLERSFEQLNSIIDETEELMIGNPSRSDFDVVETIRSAVDLIKNQLDRSMIDISLDLDRISTVKLYGQRSIFLRIILNLLVNSLEELRSNVNSKRLIEVGGSVEDGSLLISVKDNGRGLEPDEIKTLFFKDYSNKHSGKHFGLGLNFVKKAMIDEFNGKAQVESKKDKYTLVRLIFQIEDHKYDI
ncbi:HAMP domain-containing histidine kinase [Candidatus Nomurabacteria bacterium]|uniref:histidine kinase n=1 Tax=Candidatus Dojkabacteria bacterium TaxID=2099670 RepID=A0A955KXQ0_9BACT|nr:HAMP domain-containing histidine kinase [Candidatus Dojkabacteria bacterium]MCB9789717.1 HAMP domain-containing histidine kinase [Candidatus Nomurabacteria bacterium]MCB9803947.1 HAMP domain-containing histidine kinase [Candidatus Nomurabacteria bacterium]